MKKTRKTPVQQLMPMLTPDQQYVLADLLSNLKLEVADDLCLSLVAYIRIGVRRQFKSEYLQLLYYSILTLIEHPELFADNNQSNS